MTGKELSEQVVSILQIPQIHSGEDTTYYAEWQRKALIPIPDRSTVPQLRVIWYWLSSNHTSEDDLIVHIKIPLLQVTGEWFYRSVEYKYTDLNDAEWSSSVKGTEVLKSAEIFAALEQEVRDMVGNDGLDVLDI